MSTVMEARLKLPRPFGMLDRVSRKLVKNQLAGLRRGEITLEDEGGSSSLGESSDLKATMSVRDPRFFRGAVLGGTLSVAESYIKGEWDCDDLTSLFRIFVRNRDSADRLDRGLARLVGCGHRLFHWWNANTPLRSRRNIYAHYDLGNEFFRLWLDDTMAYSCGIFASKDFSLLEASVEKFDRVCRKLELTPEDEVLEIGTGWGGFAIHAASHYGSSVTTTTISREQYALATERIENAGVSHRVRVLQQDYRELTGTYDRLASIEMIEAVGHKYLDGYFRQCGRLLKPDGSLVLQAIVMPERDHAQYLKSVDFIQRFVFPGGCLPSLESILKSSARATDLRLVSVEDFAPHYAETLRQWRSRFESRLDEVRQLGHSEEFIRLWRYYLCYCEAAFEERCIGVLQIRMDKPECRRDPVAMGPPLAAFREGLIGGMEPRFSHSG